MDMKDKMCELAGNERKKAFIMCNTHNPANAARQIEAAREYLSDQYDVSSIDKQLYWPEEGVMGVASENTVRCDVVYLCKGWQMCRCSHAVFEIAMIFNKTIILED